MLQQENQQIVQQFSSVPPTPQFEYVINENGAIATLHRGWLESNYAKQLCTHLSLHTPWYTGKTVHNYPMPRAQYVMSDANIKQFKYSVIKLPVDGWQKDVGDIKDWISQDPIITSIVGYPVVCDSCLLNCYRNSQDFVDYHSDKIDKKVSDIVITVSLGDSRIFSFKSKTKTQNGGKNYEYRNRMLHNGDMMIMAGSCQDNWTHSILKEKELKDSYRISLTYRRVGPT